MNSDLAALLATIIHAGILSRLLALVAELNATMPDDAESEPPPEPYRLRPVSRVSLRCPDCGKLIASSHYSVHQCFCHDWTEWRRK